MKSSERPSQFAGLLGAVHQPQPEPRDPELQETTTKPARPKNRRPTSATKKIGRPAGKRSDPETTQVTAYIDIQTHEDIKVKILRERRQTGIRNFSGLVQHLLDEYLKA